MACAACAGTHAWLPAGRCAATNAGAGWHRWRSCPSGGLALVGDCGIGIVAGEFEEGFGQARALHLEFGQCRRSEEHTSELQSLMRISYAVFCLKKKKEKLP